MSRSSLYLPGFRNDLTSGPRKIRVGLGSDSEMVGNTDMNALAQKLSDSYGVEPVGSVTCKSSGSTAPLSFMIEKNETMSLMIIH